VPAIRLSLSIEQGTTWAHGWKPLLNGGQMITVEGWTACAQIRPSVSSGKVLHTWSTQNGSIGIDPDSGAVTLTLSDEDSAAWGWTEGVYDLEVYSPEGDTYRISEGGVKVKPEVTRECLV